MDKAASDLTPLFVEAYRLSLLRGVEDRLAAHGFDLVAGVDEAGRGCLAGPVVAAAVLLDARRLRLVPGVDDSKKLPPERRAAVAEAVQRSALCSSWIAISAKTIERVNILEATKLAMQRVLASLEPAPQVAIVDAVRLPAEAGAFPKLPFVRSDAWCYSVACASLIAKTQRDRLMQRYHHQYPEYGFGDNKGYGAPDHRRALEELGPSPIHRLTFRSVLPRRDDLCEPGARRRPAAASRVRPRSSTQRPLFQGAV